MNIFHLSLKQLILPGLVLWALLICQHSSAQTTVVNDTLIVGDTAIVITTACAPICSSVARAYAYVNKEWHYIRRIDPPFKHAVFAEAYIEDQQLRWRDNTDEMLDEEEKSHRNK